MTYQAWHSAPSPLVATDVKYESQEEQEGGGKKFVRAMTDYFQNSAIPPPYIVSF